MATLLLSAILGASPVVAGDDETQATGAAGGLYPPGTVLDGVSVSGLQAAFGVEIHPDGSALASPLSRVRAAFTQRKRKSDPNRARPTGASSISMSTRAASEASCCPGTEVSMLTTNACLPRRGLPWAAPSPGSSFPLPTN